MPQKLHLFEAYGVELEYMIVDSSSFFVKPIADELIKAVEGEIVSETNQGTISWCNELVAHVIEIKTTSPEKSLFGLEEHFQDNVRRINAILKPMNAVLMPTAMHPWMDPFRETRLWEHEYNAIYESFNRIFDCRGHGWSNLQSTHLNLPFQGDEEFGRLHAAIRVVLPILPALSASSPIMDGKVTGILDNRMEVYRHNAKRVPSVSGDIVPEPVFTEDDYRRKLLQKIYNEIAPLDPDEILQDEWLNARGAIARFDRNAIEIRVLDIQECPAADLAILKLISALIRKLTESQWTDISRLRQAETLPLKSILMDTVVRGGDALIEDPGFLAYFGVHESRMTVGELWKHIHAELGAELFKDDPIGANSIRTILGEGNLSQRIIRRTGPSPDLETIRQVYSELVDSLAEGRMFKP